MNRSQFNSSVIGASFTSAFVRAISAQAFRLIGTATGTVIKSFRVNQSMKVTLSFSPIRKVAVQISEAFALSGSFAGHVLHKTYGVMTQTMRMITQGRGHVLTNMLPVNQSMKLATTFTPHPHIAVRFTIAQNLGIATVFNGTDYAMGDAPEERTTGIVDLTTQVTDTVMIGT